MDREAYLNAVASVWDRKKPRIWWCLRGRQVARKMASALAAVVDELDTLQPPPDDEEEIRHRYLDPLRHASQILTERARTMPKQVRFADWSVETDEQMALFADDDDHAFVVRYGLRQWWLPKTPSWDPRPTTSETSSE